MLFNVELSGKYPDLDPIQCLCMLLYIRIHSCADMLRSTAYGISVVDRLCLSMNDCSFVFHSLFICLSEEGTQDCHTYWTMQCQTFDLHCKFIFQVHVSLQSWQNV